MTRRDHTFAIALLLSMSLHAATFLTLAGRQRTDPRARVAHATPSGQLVAATETAPAFDFVFGDRRGTGDSSNERAGEEKLISRDGARQAFLSRDPAGAGRVGDEPSMSVLPRASIARPSIGEANPQPMLGLGAVRAPSPSPRVRRATPTPPAQSSAPAADPAVMSDSESDPFSASKDAAIEFRDGRVDVRFGRKVKTVRPRLSLAAQYDLLSMQFPRMVVRLNVDARGDVRRVEIVKSTGSASADQEVKVALYQWWVEPARDLSGIAVADTIEFPITWR